MAILASPVVTHTGESSRSLPSSLEAATMSLWTRAHRRHLRSVSMIRRRHLMGGKVFHPVPSGETTTYTLSAISTNGRSSRQPSGPHHRRSQLPRATILLIAYFKSSAPRRFREQKGQGTAGLYCISFGMRHVAGGTYFASIVSPTDGECV